MPVRVGGVGVVAVAWALLFPPTRARGVSGNQGDTPPTAGRPLKPPTEGAGPLCTPPRAVSRSSHSVDDHKAGGIC
jgi:hypothetical protein